MWQTPQWAFADPAHTFVQHAQPAHTHFLYAQPGHAHPMRLTQHPSVGISAADAASHACLSKVAAAAAAEREAAAELASNSQSAEDLGTQALQNFRGAITQAESEAEAELLSALEAGAVAMQREAEAAAAAAEAAAKANIREDAEIAAQARCHAQLKSAATPAVRIPPLYACTRSRH